VYSKTNPSKRYIVEPRPEHLVKYGMAPEFIGRVPVTVTLNDLSKHDLVRILKEPKNALVKQFQENFYMDGVDLVFTDNALDAIAQKALDLKTGARGLRGVVEKVLMKSMYEVPSMPEVNSCTVIEACVTKGADPIYEIKEITDPEIEVDVSEFDPETEE
jgi:ATP-dependent Clp protease ATP-binding subunit ClpX